MEQATPETVTEVLAQYTADDYLWRRVPFREQQGVAAASSIFWQPLMHSIQRMQRRQDIFIAGENLYGGETRVANNGENNSIIVKNINHHDNKTRRIFDTAACLLV